MITISKIKSWLAVALLLSAGSFAAVAQNYGLPSSIQQGNILHCFNWPANEIKAELPKIAAAGFGSVQMSPLQRPDVKVGSPWHDLYRPYDLAFKSSSFCTEEDLRSLCQEASKYGIKIIVDVVANHVDKTAGYHDPWWDSNNRVRWEGGINYGNRYSITHGQLGDYGDVNSEHSDVIAKGKTYVEKLKSLGVKGIRWDAAKHIATPSEGCGFWSAVTSVSGMYHYGEILNDDGTPVNEYVKYMSITDNRYSNGAAQNNQGVQQGFGGEWNVNRGIAADKLVYWGESHDTYSNDEWSQNVSQSVIDRAYACVATRNGATALYFARPNTKGFNNIKVGKGSTAYAGKHIAEVNKFRNAMTGKADWVECNGNTCCVTRKDGGAVIVMKGSGNVSVKNGGGYCPPGTYTDKVSGGTFTVTSSTISGNVGSSGIAVIYNGGSTTPDIPDNPDVPAGSLYILGNLDGSAGWSTTPGTGVPMVQNGNKYVAKNVKFTLAAGETKCYFNVSDYVGSTWDDLNMGANRYGAATEGEAVTIGTPATMVKYANNVDASGCLSWTVAPGTYDVTVDLSAMTILLNNAGDGPDIPDTPDIPVIPQGDMWVLGNLEGSAGWSSTPGTGVPMILENGEYVAKDVKFVLAAGETRCYFNLTDYVGSTWDDLNMGANRYGAAIEGDAVTLGTPATMVKYANNVNASGCFSWTVAPGVYDVKANTNNMTITLTTRSGIDDMMISDTENVEAEYYDMSGVRMAKPSAPGCYIVKKGDKVTKVYLK